MAIITLTTDFGHRDFYQSALKGSILSRLPGVNIIDISHQIAPFNIAQAAYVVRNAYRFFPEESVHLVGVDAHYQADARYLALASEGHYFIGPDNGVFSLIFDRQPEQVVEISLQPDLAYTHFPVLDLFVKAACHLAEKGPLDALGPAATEINQRALLQPVQQASLIRGNVIHIDSYQNVITNITYPIFDQVGKGRPFELYFKRNESISSISKHYNQVTEGEKLALFGISGFLEIAINKGNAAGLLGLDLNDIIIIEFEEEAIQQ